MTRYRMTAKGEIPFTAEEDALWEAELVAAAEGKEDKLAERVRKRRDALLEATDWVVTRAKELGQPVPLDVYNYRGDLRQLPEQEGFPHNVTWPEEV